MLMIGKGACHMFSTVLECESGIQLSRSNISGKLIVSGRTERKESSCLNQMIIMNHNKSIINPANDPLLVAERIMESPLKRCLTCKNCIACQKEMRPDQVRQIKQKEQAMNNLSFDKEEGYSITYPKNTLLQELPENSESVKRMMKSLESKLIKNGLLSQFNECLK